MLEIGKYYLQRNGIVVGPLREYTGQAINSGFKFCINQDGYADRTWKANGSFLLYQSDTHPYDIVSGVQFVPLNQQTQQPKEEIVSKEFKIEAGKYYEDRDGDVHGPMLSNDNEDYPFRDQDCLTYTLYGKYVDGDVSHIDLIEEVPNPCDINPEPVMKNNNPTIEEVLSAIQRGDEVVAKDGADGNIITKYARIHELIDADSFEIKPKQPVVKYKYAFQEKDSTEIQVSRGYFVDADDFLDGDSENGFEFFEPIQATRKEF